MAASTSRVVALLFRLLSGGRGDGQERTELLRGLASEGGPG